MRNGFQNCIMKQLVLVIMMWLSVPTVLFSQNVLKDAITSDNSQIADNKADLNGYVRGILYTGAKNADFSSLFGEFALKSSISSGKTFLKGDIRIRDGLFYDERNSVCELKEAYAGYNGAHCKLFLGNQIVTWGRTDGFNPTNNLSPTDYFFLTPEPDDQKLSNFMVRAKIRIKPSAELEIIGIPAYKPSVYRYDLFDMGPGVSFRNLVLPDRGMKNATLAARCNIELPAAGFSISWFHGYDPFYGFNLDSFSVYPSTHILYRPAVYRKNVLGADFAIPVKNWIIRGETVLNLIRDGGKAMYIPYPDFAWVGAVEHNFFGFTLICQYIGKTVLDYKPLLRPVLTDPVNPAAQLSYAANLIRYESTLFNRKIFFQQEKSNHALFISLSGLMAHDLLNLEMSGYYNLTSKESLIRSMVKWNLSDALSATFGFSCMLGPDQTVFDKAGKVLNGYFIGLTASF
jgi:hypothetical protein